MTLSNPVHLSPPVLSKQLPMSWLPPDSLYLTGSAALGPEYTGLGVQTLAAVSLTGVATTIDSQREVDAILALGRGLNSKLDECVSVNIVTAL